MNLKALQKNANEAAKKSSAAMGTRLSEPTENDALAAKKINSAIQKADFARQIVKR